MKNKTLIIAEVGVNHNGNIKLAKKLINVAKESGADYDILNVKEVLSIVKKENQE